MPASNALGVPRYLPPKHIIVCCVLSVLLWLNPLWYLCAFSWKRTDVLQQTRGADIKTRREKNPPTHSVNTIGREVVLTSVSSTCTISEMVKVKATKEKACNAASCLLAQSCSDLGGLTDNSAGSFCRTTNSFSRPRISLPLLGYRNPPLIPLISHINPTHTVRPTYLRSEICFNNILSPITNSFKCYLSDIKHGNGAWHIPLLCVQWKTPDDGQRNCPKHVEFYSKNKFEKLVHLVGFSIRI